MRLENLIQEEIYNFLYNLSVEYKLDIGDLHYMWDLFNYKIEEDKDLHEKREKKHENEIKQPKKISENENEQSKESGETNKLSENENEKHNQLYESPCKKYKKCKYLYTKGDKINKECNSKIFNDLYNYCSKHRKEEKKMILILILTILLFS